MTLLPEKEKDGGKGIEFLLQMLRFIRGAMTEVAG